MVDVRTRYEMQDSEIQYTRCKIQDTRYKIQDTRCKIQDTRYKIIVVCDPHTKQHIIVL